MWWVWTALLAGIPLVIFALYKYYTGNRQYWPKLGVPLVDLNKIIPFWDRVLFRLPFHEVEQTTYDEIRKMQPEAGFIGFMEMRAPSLYLMDLDLAKAVLVKDFDHFVDRRTFDMSKADPYLNEMLVMLNGQEWKNMRNTLSPTFSTGKIRKMFEIFNQCGDKMTNFIKQELASSKTELEFRDVSSRFTMDVIANAAFGVDSKVFEDSDAPFAEMGKRVQNQFKSPFAFLKLIIAVFAPKLVNLLRISFFDQKAFGFFANVIKSSKESRKNSGKRREDFLQLLIDTQAGELTAEEDDKHEIDVMNEKSMELQKASKVHLTDLSLTAQSLLFFLGGFDTTETLLVLAMYELAVNPDVQEQLYQQMKDLVDRNNGMLSYDTIASCQYLDMVVSETLRKYPPGIRLERKCTRDYTLPGTNVTIKKGQFVIIPVMGIHHDEQYYPDPEKFDPERFSTENKATRHPYAYMPFGQGPRSCIAMRFALVEGKAALAHLVLKFRLEPSASTTIPLKFASKLALKPENGLWLKITARV